MKLSSLPDILALKRSIVGMLCMVILLGTGERMTERFIPLYILAVGGSDFAIGLFQGLINLLGSLYSWPAGILTDRVGEKKALLVFNLLSIAGYIIAIIFPLWEAAVAGAVLFLGWSAISMPATMKLISSTLPLERHTMGVSMHSLVRRIPMALGPVLGGYLIVSFGEKTGIRLGFSIAIIFALLAIFIQQKLIEEKTLKPQNDIPKHPVTLYRAMQPELKRLLLSDILIRFCEQIPYAFVVIWCMKIIAEPVTAVQFGVLTSIEMITALLIYIPVAWFADRSGKEPFVKITFLFFTAFPFVILFCHSFWPLVFAFILRGLKEFGEPSRKALILDLCPAQTKASMFGVYYLIRDSIVSLAAFGGAFLWDVSPTVNLICAGSFGLIGSLLFLRQDSKKLAPCND